MVSETATGGGAGFMVNRDNVLQIGRAFAEEAARLQTRLNEYSGKMITKPALGDPASTDYAAALNRKLVGAEDSYVKRAQGYIDELNGVARQCAAAAQEYGYTDEQIGSAMRGVGDSLAG